MQKEVDDGVIIACDFCGTDWDQVKPMVEGHRGSVLCLECLKLALEATAAMSDDFACTLCLGSQPAGTNGWCPAVAGANAEAAICGECMQQAAEAFGKDRGVDFQSDEAQGGMA